MNRPTRLLFRLLKQPPPLIYALGLGPVYGRLVLLLTTTGRKSGTPRVTPLQYEEIDGDFYIAAARGQNADWFRNLTANPQVQVRVKSRRFHGRAAPVADPAHIADFLAVRFTRHPRMMGMIFRAQGLPARPNRAQLEKYAQNRVMVIIHPTEG
jgi:deazaflavin-dependent oxidoreductase (nitroreductase family)